ncbi:MAG: Lipid II flippase MurJ [Chlamydiia bacterium]|nr:Lipid II flippase MurJ [Chlamydiia bacterium]
MKLGKAALLFSSGTLFSRLTGLLRDVGTAAVFGASAPLAAFMVAFRFSSLLRRVLGEGPLSSSFIPHYEELKKGNGEQAFFGDMFATLSLVTGAIVILGELVMWPFREAQIVHLTMLMLPGLYFICLSGLSSAYLHTEKRFFLSGIAPALFNVVWIVSLVFVRRVETLAVVVVLAFAAQFVMTSFVSFPLTLVSLRPFSRDVRCILAPFGLGILGIAAAQINSALDPLFARAAMLEGPAYLWYAIRIYQLPIALIGIALSNAILPALSRTSAKGKLVKEGVLMMLLLMSLATLGLFVFGGWIVELLYHHGNFSTEAARLTKWCLWAYAVGLIPSGLVLILAPAHFARKSYKAPAVISVITVSVNIALNSLFVFGLGWGAFSVALATSASAYINLALLVISEYGLGIRKLVRR